MLEETEGIHIDLPSLEAAGHADLERNRHALEEAAHAFAPALPLTDALASPTADRPLASDKVMLPAKIMREPAELRRWIARAFKAAAALPEKAAAAKPGRNAAAATTKEPAAKRTPRKRPPNQ
jgi:hypothetical protein